MLKAALEKSGPRRAGHDERGGDEGFVGCRLLHGVSLSFENPKRGVHSERRRGRHPDERDVCGRCVGLSRPTTRRFIFRMRIFRIVPESNVEPQTRVVNARVERVVGAACKQNTSSL